MPSALSGQPRTLKGSSSSTTGSNPRSRSTGPSLTAGFWRGVSRRSPRSMGSRSHPAASTRSRNRFPGGRPFPRFPANLASSVTAAGGLRSLSNTDPDLLAASAESLGVPFNATITASEAGSYKPAAGHWERFFSTTGCDREHHVHVAASLFHDIEPADRLGLRAVWINRLGESSDLPRAAELPSLAGLADELERFGD